MILSFRNRGTEDVFDVRDTKADQSLIPDMTGMPLRLAMELLARRGCVPTVKGSGVVVTKQSPDPGDKLAEKNVVLWLGGKDEQG